MPKKILIATIVGIVGGLVGIFGGMFGLLCHLLRVVRVNNDQTLIFEDPMEWSGSVSSDSLGKLANISADLLNNTQEN